MFAFVIASAVVLAMDQPSFHNCGDEATVGACGGLTTCLAPCVRLSRVASKVTCTVNPNAS